jgi:hypothetical protein
MLPLPGDAGLGQLQLYFLQVACHVKILCSNYRCLDIEGKRWGKEGDKQFDSAVLSSSRE